MMPTGATDTWMSHQEQIVSILVLLDDAYRLVVITSKGNYIPWFQSLFFWMMPTGRKTGVIFPPMKRFQSLFFWMMPTGN